MRFPDSMLTVLRKLGVPSQTLLRVRSIAESRMRFSPVAQVLGTAEWNGEDRATDCSNQTKSHRHHEPFPTNAGPVSGGPNRYKPGKPAKDVRPALRESPDREAFFPLRSSVPQGRIHKQDQPGNSKCSV